MSGVCKVQVVGLGMNAVGKPCTLQHTCTLGCAIMQLASGVRAMGPMHGFPEVGRSNVEASARACGVGQQPAVCSMGADNGYWLRGLYATQ